ncbi:ADP-ribosylation factor-like protein 2 [Octodon degus]|uniref:ADP-ribosylation factor-like protein 2 n=1 Tax=Octodon degus TaxID=10160 RepID=A0A6P3VEA6_OCTDE|nr:ADP-ribosylation factor-like protein 2 [Octodon degus]
MGLLTILKKMKQKERELRLLMLGLDNAGKTTILKKFNGEDVDTISPTLGFNIKTLEHRGFKLNVWDVGGQKSLRSYWRNYFESTDGLIWVVDSADRQRLQDCARELQGLLVEERLAGATLLIFANKQDLPGALSSNAIQEALELDSIRSHHWCIQGCTPSTGMGTSQQTNTPPLSPVTCCCYCCLVSSQGQGRECWDGEGALLLLPKPLIVLYYGENKALLA